MKKKDIILISIIIILVISLIGTIIYYNQNKELTIEGEILAIGSNYLLVGTTNNEDYVINTKDTNYQIGDKLKLELTNINVDKTPYEATAKNITIIRDRSNQENTKENKEEITDNNTDIKDNTNVVNDNSNIDNFNNTDKNQASNNKENYTEAEIITYFETLNNELTAYDNSDESLGKTIKSNFVKCIDFIFYNKEIGGKNFNELTNTAKLKILSIALSIDSKIENKFPKYKESISSTYQNIKSKIIEKYLEITTNICTNDQDLCKTAKEGFKELKDNFGITWDVIKSLANNGISKIKDWYEIWRYN